MTTVTDDILAVTQVVLLERQGRDRGWWGQMQSCFDSDSLVSLSWIHDTGAAFVERSKASFDSGVRPVHQLAPPVVHLDGDRAVVEVGAQIQFRDEMSGVPVDLVSFTRLLYQLQREGHAWKIKTLRAIYERDTLVPVIPGATVELDSEILAQFRAPYRYLAYHLSQLGQTIGEDLYGDDQPERVASLYTEVFDWLHRT